MDTVQAPLLGEREPLAVEPGSAPLSSVQLSPRPHAVETTADAELPPLALPRPPVAEGQPSHPWTATPGSAAPTPPVVQQVADDVPTPPVVQRVAQDVSTGAVGQGAAQEAPPALQRAHPASPPGTPAATPFTLLSPAEGVGGGHAPAQHAGRPALPVVQRTAHPRSETIDLATAPTPASADVVASVQTALATEDRSGSPVTGKAPLVGEVPLLSESATRAADHGAAPGPDGGAPGPLSPVFTPPRHHAAVPASGDDRAGGRALTAVRPLPVTPIPAAAWSTFSPVHVQRATGGQGARQPVSPTPGPTPRPSAHLPLQRLIGTPPPFNGLAAGPTMPAAPGSAAAAPVGGALPINGVALQRALEAPPAPSTAPGPDAVSPATSAAGPRPEAPHASAAEPEQQGVSIDDLDLDALTRRLADPLLRRIKRELRLDRDRAGHLTDLGR